MNQCQAAGQVVVREVWEISPQLTARQHTFIYNVLIRQRTDIKILVVDTVFYLLPYLIKRALKHRHIVIAHTRDEHLLDVWLNLESRCT